MSLLLARLEALRAVQPARVAELRAALFSQPDFPAAPEQLQDAIADLMAVKAGIKGWSANSLSALATPGIDAPRRLYLLGALNLRAGNQGAVVQAIEQLNGYPMSEGTEAAFAREYAQLLRARVELQRHQPANTLTLLGPPRPEPLRILPDPMSYVEADERFARAEAHRALGEHAAALRWYETFPDLAGYDLPYLGLATLRRAELYTRLGRAADARARYEYFLELNRNAEAALAPLVNQAKAALSALDGPAGKRSRGL